MIWASANRRCSLDVDRIPAGCPITARQERSGWPSVYRRRKERGPFLRATSDSIRNSLLAKTDANWRKLT
jgi:hypothetical protein